MKNSQSTDQNYNLWTLLAQTREAMFKAGQKELRRYNITGRKAAVLFIIQAIGYEATPAEIARWLFRESHTVSELLNRMEKQGLVRKVKDLDRKNLVRVELTAKGQEARSLIMKREAIHRIMSSLSEKQRQQLTSLLRTLRDTALKELTIVRKIPFPPLQ